MLNSWYFKNENTIQLEEHLSEEDVKLFGSKNCLHLTDSQIMDYLKNSVLTIETCIFNLKTDFERNKRVLWR